MKIMMVMAHPDDEVIFGWPILQRITATDSVVVATLAHNRQNHGEGPLKALAEVCQTVGATMIPIRRTDTNFYRIPPRPKEGTKLRDVIDDFSSDLLSIHRTFRPDFVFTHNPMGEYGHGDHRFVFNLVTGLFQSVAFTNMCFFNACHLGSNELPSIWRYLFERMNTDPQWKCICQMCQRDEQWYQAMKSIYLKHNAWSWSDEKSLPTTAGLYVLSLGGKR